MSHSLHLWRVIDSGPRNAFYNMALDEAIARSVMKGEAPPTLRIYTWYVMSVTLGRFQRLSDVDLAYCKANRIPIVRRPTGGRAILHSPVELTYSFSAPNSEALFSGGLFECYTNLSRAFMKAFTLAGLDVQASGRGTALGGEGKNPLCFRSTSYGEITLGGSKIIGSAQRRWEDGMLQQGSIPIKVPRDETARVFMSPREAGGLMGLNEADPSITYESLMAYIIEGFQGALGISLRQEAPSAREEEIAINLVSEKYSAHEWNALR